MGHMKGGCGNHHKKNPLKVSNVTNTPSAKRRVRTLTNLGADVKKLDDIFNP